MNGGRSVYLLLITSFFIIFVFAHGCDDDDDDFDDDDTSIEFVDDDDGINEDDDVTDDDDLTDDDDIIDDDDVSGDDLYEDCMQFYMGCWGLDLSVANTYCESLSSLTGCVAEVYSKWLGCMIDNVDCDDLTGQDNLDAISECAEQLQANLQDCY